MAKKTNSVKAGAIALAVLLGAGGVAVGTTALVKQIKDKNNTTVTQPTDEDKNTEQTSEQEIAQNALANFGL